MRWYCRVTDFSEVLPGWWLVVSRKKRIVSFLNCCCWWVIISLLLVVVVVVVGGGGGGCCWWWWVIVLLLLGGNCRGSWTEYQLPCSIRYPIRLVHPLPLIPQIGGGGHLCVQRNGVILPHDVMFLETMMFCLTFSDTANDW